MITLHETGQLDEVELIATSGTPLAPAAGYAERNPLTKVPALARPDGCTLYDSRVICRYLDDRAQAGLYGQGETVWQNLTVEATGDGMTDAALLMVYETRLRAPDAQSVAWIEGQWRKIDQALDAIEARWMSFLQEPLSIGQISVACALGYLDLRHDAQNWRDGRANLSEWFKEFSGRESFQKTSPG